MHTGGLSVLCTRKDGTVPTLHIEKKGKRMPLCGWNKGVSDGLRMFATGSQTTLSKEGKMAWCGHNSNMADGLAAVSGGLGVQTRKRAKEEGVDIAQIPAIEIEEIDALLEALKASPKYERLRGVASVGELIRFFYVELGRALRDDPSRTVEAVFDDVVSELNRLLFGMEEHYYQDLRPALPRLEAVRKIVVFLEREVG